MIFTSEGPPIPESSLRDDLTLPQFILDAHHHLRPQRGYNRPWFIDYATGRQYDLEECRSRTFGLANALAGLYNISATIRGMLLNNHSVDYPIAIWAVHRLGAIVSGGNPSYTVSELGYQLMATKATLIIAHSACLSVAQETARKIQFPQDRIICLEPPNKLISEKTSPRAVITVEHLIERGLSDLNIAGPKFVERRLQPGEGKTKVAFLSLSSGTTGKPKAVAISHYAPISNLIQMGAYWRLNDPTVPFEERRCRDGDVSLGVLPMFRTCSVCSLHFHIYGWVIVVFLPKYTFHDFLSSITRYRITHLWLVPPQMIALIKHPDTKKYDLSHVRCVVGGAAPVSSTLELELRKVLPGASTGQGFGMTALLLTVRPWPSHIRNGTLGSAGRLITNVEAKVVKEDGTLSGYDEPGELLVRSPSLALRYENNPQATKETFQDGWLRTGDEVMFNRSGDIFIMDRTKARQRALTPHLRGYQVAPAELEGHLLGHPAVTDAGVIGVPDEYSGDLPFAFVVLEQGAAERAAKDGQEREDLRQSIAKHVSDHKVRYKWLDGGIEFLDAIPKNPSVSSIVGLVWFGLVLVVPINDLSSVRLCMI
ncbi:hypothetical protein BS47DRAFT_1293743 [Hydnum rufescens UP504]|uniref:Acetyl-CoA synthetase-like protein n=1 Tax=Hydnum rufescens UP504 TaxID=1448309 RepID=A0A9P6B132_9AGAM|nr:hypothetical protein BS47DRAFT_1293743 [Hydnum rufescens UP504]